MENKEYFSHPNNTDVQCMTRQSLNSKYLW